MCTCCSKASPAPTISSDCGSTTFRGPLRAPQSIRALGCENFHAGNYLGGVRLHLTGSRGGGRTALRLICRHANALAHIQLGPRLRYVVVRDKGPCASNTMQLV